MTTAQRLLLLASRINETGLQLLTAAWGVNIEDLDFAGRRCPVKAKGARTKARRRGQVREDFVLETVRRAGRFAADADGVVETLQDRLVIVVPGGATARVRPVADLQDVVARLVAASLSQPNQGLQS